MNEPTPMPDEREDCAGCGAPAGMSPAGPCPGHPLTWEQRTLISNAYRSGLQHGEESARAALSEGTP